MANPADFPLGSIESRAAARKLLENIHSADDWKTIRLQFDSVEKAKEMARLFRNRTRAVRGATFRPGDGQGHPIRLI